MKLAGRRWWILALLFGTALLSYVDRRTLSALAAKIRTDLQMVGRQQKLDALERPQLPFVDGQPVALCCAFAKGRDRDGSYNLQIPLKLSK